MIVSINVDHVATLRQARQAAEPDPVMAACLAVLGGADGITAHLREDRRHMNDRDLERLRELPKVNLNLEMAATQEMIGIALRIRPDMVTLVPEKRLELTTEGGLDLHAAKERVSRAVDTLGEAGIPVSLFINPSPADVEMAARTGAKMVEIHTGLYANSLRGAQQAAELQKVTDAVNLALSLGLVANAGHGLDYGNVAAIARIAGLGGLYIGHSIVSRAVLAGMEAAVRQMKALAG